ncbi:MAG: cyclic nucleotide-binding domain-containing protein [Geitlerinemataceae cyanobacterium]
MSTLFSSIFNDIIQIFNTSISLGETAISLKDIFQLIIAIFLFFFFCRSIKKILRNRILTKFKIDEGNREAISTLVSYGFGIFGLIVVLQAMGLKLDSLAVVVGGLGVGIGFGLQNMAKDFISGFTLLLERKIKVGDFVELDVLSGYIKEVALRSTLIRTRNGGDVVVPNGHLIDQRILNWTLDSYVARIEIPVGVAYESDPLLVTETLLNAAYSESSVLSEPPPKVMFVGFGDSALNFELWVWVNRIDLEHYIRSSLNFNIEYNFRVSGLQIPFPQQDVWIKNPEAFSSGVAAKSLSDPDENRSQIPVPPVQSMPLRKLLQQVTYFANFSELQLRQLIEIGFRQKLAKSEILFRENDPGDAFYIVLSGSVEVFVEKLDKRLTVLPSGKFLGELSLMLGIPRTASVRAIEDTILFVINRTGFQNLLQEHSDVYELLIKELEKCQSELAERREELHRLGLIDDEEDTNPIVWMRKRLKNLFSLA